MHVINKNTVNVSFYISICNELITRDETVMAVLGLHVFLERGLNKLQREMCQKTWMEINSIKTAVYNLMGTIPTHKIRLLLSIIQICVNKTISQFSTHPNPSFKPNFRKFYLILYSRSAQTGLIEALLFYFATKKL